MWRRQVLTGLVGWGACAAIAAARDVSAVKGDILALAQQTALMRDQTAARVRLDGLVRDMLAMTPQKPLRQRLPQLLGAWSTVLAPSDRPDQGRKNPRIDTAHVVQVVTDKGYYYNIIPFIDTVRPAKSRLGLLRGEYGFSDADPTLLTIHYTRFYGCEGCVADPAPWRFAALEEARRLPNRVTIVPDLLLPVVLPDDTVLEVWSDADMRLAYGTRDRKTGMRSLYVMRKLEV